jgi:hypothetical protein
MKFPEQLHHKNEISLKKDEKTGSILNPGKIRNLINVILLGIIGYWLGPEELPAGNYIAKIEALVEGQRLSIAYPFTIGQETGQTATITL